MKWYQWLWNIITAPIVFIADLFKEADSNGGKASFSRVAGAYVVYKIVMLVEMAPHDQRALAVPEAMMTMFWVLIGYAIVSKILSSLSPAVLDIFKAMLLKAGAKVDLPEAKKE
jgi:hypothetical protein